MSLKIHPKSFGTFEKQAPESEAGVDLDAFLDDM